MAVLIDTNFLVALSVRNDINHSRARKAISDYKGQRVLPVPVLPELFYMVSVRAGYEAAVNVYGYIHQAGFQIEPLTPDDRIRVGEIMKQYLDAEFDFVDLSIMAQAERLGITKVFTFDRRDFSIFRPKHCTHLELLP